MADFLTCKNQSKIDVLYERHWKNEQQIYEQF